MNDDLAVFLLARIAEDEAKARTLPPPNLRWAPARVLAECETKRLIIKEHGSDRWDCAVCAEEESFSEDSDGNGEWYRSAKHAPCPTLRFLALPYSDHPDYREEWRP